MPKLQRPDHNTLCVIYRESHICIRRQLVGNPRLWVERIRDSSQATAFSLDVPSL